MLILFLQNNVMTVLKRVVCSCQSSFESLYYSTFRVGDMGISIAVSFLLLLYLWTFYVRYWTVELRVFFLFKFIFQRLIVVFMDFLC
jgi:hypothetical protein